MWTLQREDLESDLPNRPPEVSLRAALPLVGASKRILLEDASVSAKSSRGHAPARPSSLPEDSDSESSLRIAHSVKARQVMAGGVRGSWKCPVQPLTAVPPIPRQSLALMLERACIPVLPEAGGTDTPSCDLTPPCTPVALSNCCSSLKSAVRERCRAREGLSL